MRHIFPKLRWSYVRKNVQSVVFLWSLVAINATLFVTRTLSHIDHWPYGALARANGQCLNFCCSAILLCVLRRSITYLRSVGFSKFLPLDHHIYYHKVIGWIIVFASVFHTAMHVLNFDKLSKITSVPLRDYLFATHLSIGWIGGLACVTGWVLLIILAIIMITSQPFMRRSGKFEVFYHTHHLYLLFYAILFVHAPHFWMWFIGPGFLFAIEAVLRVAKSFGADHGLTYIEQGIILPSRVIQLILKRPPNFEYHPGDYVYVQIPAITKYEWHPLTISSAPEQEGVLWLHVRVVGEWTNRLYNYFTTKERNTPLKQKDFQSIPQNSPSVFNSTFSSSDGDPSTPVHSGPHSILTRKRSTSIKSRQIPDNARIMLLPVPVDCNEFGCGKEAVKTKQRVVEDIEMAPSPISKSSFGSLSRLRSPLTKNEPFIYKSATILAKPLRVRLDGPYGTPTSDIFHTQHAVLIATGIGVTPFASILQSIMLRYIDAKRICPNCAYSWSDPPLPNVMKLKKVDFMWINRDQKHFEWFVSLLSELYNIQEELVDRFLDIHAHLTSKTDTTTAGNGIDDSYTFGLKLRKGRPDWHRFFRNISAQRKGKITVFFCGNADLARLLRSKCVSYGFEFRKEVF